MGEQEEENARKEEESQNREEVQREGDELAVLRKGTKPWGRVQMKNRRVS